MPSSQRRNPTRYRCDPRVPGLSLLDAAFTDHDYRPHVHSEMVVAVTEAGGAIVSSGALEVEARPGTVLVLNADEVQSARMGYSRRWVYRSFYFGRNALEGIYRGGCDGSRLLRPKRTDQPFPAGLRHHTGAVRRGNALRQSTGASPVGPGRRATNHDSGRLQVCERGGLQDLAQCAGSSRAPVEGARSRRLVGGAGFSPCCRRHTDDALESAGESGL